MIYADVAKMIKIAKLKSLLLQAFKDTKDTVKDGTGVAKKKTKNIVDKGAQTWSGNMLRARESLKKKQDKYQRLYDLIKQKRETLKNRREALDNK